MTLIRSISGIRATVDESLTPEIISQYVLAYCSILPDGDIVVGRDGRPSGNWIKDIVINSIRTSGRNVKLLDIAPTPTIQLLTEKTDAAGGISITASHNPKEWNGLKFLDSNGIFLDQSENEKLWEKLDSKSSGQKSEQINTKVENHDGVKYHIDIIKEVFSQQIETTKGNLEQRNFKVVVDAVNASGSKYIPELLKELNCEVVELYTDNSGEFPHIPEPIPENLTELGKSVIKENADLGIAVDPDADRLVLIDETGKPIGEEKTIALSVKSIFSILNKQFNDYDKNVVVNLSTSAMVEFVAADFNGKVYRSPVGEINVVQKMKEVNAVIGGEGSGGVILPAVHYGRDSLVGTVLVLLLIANENKTVSELSSSLPELYMHKSKIELDKEPHIYLDIIENEYFSYELDKQDGLRVKLNKEEWFHVRPSNTEPIMRIIVEAGSPERAKEISENVSRVLD